MLFTSEVPFLRPPCRYHILSCGKLPKTFIEAKQAAEIIMKETKIDEIEYRYGQHKVRLECSLTENAWLIPFTLASCTSLVWEISRPTKLRITFLQ